MIPCTRVSVRALALALTAAVCAAGEPPPESVYIGGNIYTLDPARPRVEALGVAKGRIVSTGSNAAVLATKTPETKVVSLNGRTVLPGLIDSHGHMAGLGSFAFGRLDLSAARSFDDVIAIVAEAVKRTPKGQWILGGRWDHESWPDRQLPGHDALSAVSPENPVWLTRVDGHAGLANAEAMRRANVSRETPSPPGGEIHRDRAGDATGIFVDNAMSLVTRVLDAPSTSTTDLLLKAQELCLAAGLTGVHDAGISPADADVYRTLADEGRLKLRVYAMLSAPFAINYFESHELEFGERFTMRSVKLYADGAMGSRGAWLLEPYADRPIDEHGRPYTGLAVAQMEFIRRVSEHGLIKGYQVCTHAIGDRANREVLDAYSLALSRRPRPDHRFRIEHAQLLSFEDIPRFEKLGVVPAMQPTHCTSDMRWVEARVGEERAKGAYAWASLLRSGARIAGGSDFPVESHNPFLGLYAAITRQDLEGRPDGGWRPEQRLTREEALRSFTLDAAYAAFEESQKGSLEVGKLADFIVIDRDVMTCAERDIPDTKVLRTVIGGETVYERAPIGGE